MKRSPYDVVSDVLHALRDRDDMTKKELRDVINGGMDDHQAIRVWQWLLDAGFAELGPTRMRRNMRTATIRLAQAWRNPPTAAPR